MNSILRLLQLGLLLLLVSLMGVGFQAQGRFKKTEVKGALRIELNDLLKAANGLHTACIDADEQAIDRQLRVILNEVRDVRQKADLAIQHRTHLIKMMSAIASPVRLSQTTTGEARRKQLKEAFRQLVQLYHFYKLDPYKVFFCGSDRSVWLQKSSQPKNPVNPGHRNCGKLVR